MIRQAQLLARKSLGIIAFEALLATRTGSDREAGPLVLGVSVGVDVAEIHPLERWRERKDPAIDPGCARDIARRLRTEALADADGVDGRLYIATAVSVTDAMGITPRKHTRRRKQRVQRDIEDDQANQIHDLPMLTRSRFRIKNTLTHEG